MSVRKCMKMAHTAFFVIILPLIGAIACVSGGNSFEQASGRSDSELLLKVRTIASEVCYPYGEITDIELYEDKHIEFDFYLPNTAARVGSPLSLERKSLKIDQTEFDRFTMLLNQPDLLHAENIYRPLRMSPMSIDSKIKKTLSVRNGQNEKEIVLEEYDCRLYLDEPPSYVKAKPNPYPKSLIELLKLVEITNADSRKRINPEAP